MKDLLKICRRYITAAFLIVCLVFAVNLLFFFVYLVQEHIMKEDPFYDNWRTAELSDALVRTEKGYSMSSEALKQIDSRYAFAMLLDEQGQVVWSRNLPEDIPLSYSIKDIASMTRWYLKDYPVKVWEHPDGLFVVAAERNSIAKYDFTLQISTLHSLPAYLGAYLLCNLLLILFLSLFSGFRLYRSLKAVASGIENLHLQNPLHLPERGMTATLAQKLNDASILLFRQKLALDKRDNARAEWICGVSHDIRTPLSLIIGHAESLGENFSLDAESRKEAACIRENGLQIRKLISDLNLVTRLEYDACPLRLASCSPAALIRALAAWHINNGLSESYELDIDIAPEMESAVLEGDPELLSRAFRNLTGNSIRHNPEGCRILIRLRSLSDRAEFVFSDTGSGIPADVIKVLYRPNGSSSDTGHLKKASPAPHVMGLRIVKQIIEAHQGEIFFSPEGTICRQIRILLPLKSR